MKTSAVIAVGTWALVVGANAVQAQLLPPQTFTGAAALPWQIVLTPIVIIIGAFFTRGHPGEFIIGSWVDGRFGSGAYCEFMDALRLPLMLAAMCLSILLSALARNFLLKTPIFPPAILGFFASSTISFLSAYYIQRAHKNSKPVRPRLAKSTPMQRYYMFHIAWMRWFGVVFAGTSILITACNIPWLIHSKDPTLIATNVGGGAVFILIGLALYLVGTAVQRRYRAHIAQQID